MKGPKNRTTANAVVNRLLRYMGEKNISLYKIAQLGGVPFSTLKHLMQRKNKKVSLDTVICIAAGLGIEPWEFLQDESFSRDNLDIDYNF